MFKLIRKKGKQWFSLIDFIVNQLYTIERLENILWGESMVQTTILLGIVFAVLALIINFVLLKANKQSYACYYTSFFFFISGLLLLAIASVLPKVDLLGAGFGGWGIAALFASAVSFMITAILDAYQNAEA